MLTNHFVVQKIEPNSTVTLYQVGSEYLTWNFETRRKSTVSDHKEVFPFKFEGLSLRKSSAGAETSVRVRDKEYVVFNDKYGVSAGVTVGVLFPIGFAPSIELN